MNLDAFIFPSSFTFTQGHLQIFFLVLFDFNNQLNSIFFHDVVVLPFPLMPFSLNLNINKFIDLQQNKAWFYCILV
jgi:hypothetical protein